MSITTRWIDEEQTVLLISYRGTIAEQDFIETMNRVHQQIAGRTQPVHIVHDYGNSNAEELLNAQSHSAGSGAIAS